MHQSYRLALATLLLAACSGGGPQSKADTTVTGPTNPQIVVQCVGDTHIDVDVDCGDRPVDSFNPAPHEDKE